MDRATKEQVQRLALAHPNSPDVGFNLFGIIEDIAQKLRLRGDEVSDAAELITATLAAYAMQQVIEQERDRYGLQ